MGGNYYKNCPKCGGKLRCDDIDYSFEGCQDEYSECPNCHLTFYVKVRFGEISSIDIRQMVQDPNTGEWYLLE